MRKERIVSTQEELDKLTSVGTDELVIIRSSASLELNANIEVRGALRIEVKINFKWNRVEAWGNSSVVARENSSVEAWGNSSVEARENSSVVARGAAIVRVLSDIAKITAHGLTTIVAHVKCRGKIESTSVVVRQVETVDDYFEREGIAEDKTGSVILFKRVSKDFKTQEGSPNETTWTVGKKITHHAWTPENGECGPGKFHACSRPYFCDEFRNTRGDVYIAIKVKKADTYQHKNPLYQHKIAFREGKVMHVCDRFGKKIAKGA